MITDQELSTKFIKVLHERLAELRVELAAGKPVERPIAMDERLLDRLLNRYPIEQQQTAAISKVRP
jgi:hypothetical protein